MNILSQGEDVSSSCVLKMVSNAIDRLRSMEESENGAAKDAVTQESFKTSSDGQKLSKYELWKMKVDALREFSIPNPNSSHSFSDHIDFLESVKNYLTSNQ